jgi:hypothetical protein
MYAGFPSKENSPQPLSSYRANVYLPAAAALRVLKERGVRALGVSGYWGKRPRSLRGCTYLTTLIG